MTTDKILVAGDFHSNGHHAQRIMDVAREHEIATIIQLGDFGFTFEPSMMTAIAKWCDEWRPYRQFLWLDGNHDQHDTLEHLVKRADDMTIIVPKPRLPIHMSLVDQEFPFGMHYCPRGSFWGPFLFLGGAYSIDKAYRTPHVSWWEQETITAADMYRAVETANVQREKGVPITHMFTHDMPVIPHIEAQFEQLGYKNDPSSRRNRQHLSRVVDEVRPQHLYHGHMHRRYDDVYVTPDGWVVQVHGIGADISPKFRDSYTIIDMPPTPGPHQSHLTI